MHSSLPTRASFRGPHSRKALRLVLLDVLLRGRVRWLGGAGGAGGCGGGGGGLAGGGGGGATEGDCIVVQDLEVQDVAAQLAASTGRTRGATRALEAVRKEMSISAADSSSGPSQQLRPQSQAVQARQAKVHGSKVFEKRGRSGGEGGGQKRRKRGWDESFLKAPVMITLPPGLRPGLAVAGNLFYFILVFWGAPAGKVKK